MTARMKTTSLKLQRNVFCTKSLQNESFFSVKLHATIKKNSFKHLNRKLQLIHRNVSVAILLCFSNICFRFSATPPRSLVHDVISSREKILLKYKILFFSSLSVLSGEFECVQVNNVSVGMPMTVIV